MLNSEDRKFIIDSVKRGYKVSELAKMFNVTPRRIQQILHESASPDSEKDSELTEDEKRFIDELWDKYKIGSRTIYYLLRSKGMNVSYYRIYNYMKFKRMVHMKADALIINGKEADPPLTTVLMDYHQKNLNDPYAIFCVDMTTKKILSYAESLKITSDVVSKVIDNLYTGNVKIKHLMIRSGVLSLIYNTSYVSYRIRRKGIQDVVTDKNGSKVHLSLSKLWQNYDRYRWTFQSIDDFVHWYNERPVTRFEDRIASPGQIFEEYIRKFEMQRGED